MGCFCLSNTNELKLLSCAYLRAKMNMVPVFVNFPIYTQFRIALYELGKASKHINKQAQIFALFVQKLFFFLCGSGQVPIKVVFQASFPCSGAGSPPPLLSPILFESVRKARGLQV